MRIAAPSIAVFMACLPGLAQAHGNLVIGQSAAAPIWLAQALFVAAWLGYALGAKRVRPARYRQLLLHGAMLLGGAALFGPFDSWAESSTAMHMVQHMLVIVVMAPLLVLARPLAQWRALLGSGLDPLWRVPARASRHPMACALLHAAAIWIWHAPAPYEAALHHSGLHVLEHASFLLTGGLFWWSVLGAGRRGAPMAGVALLFTLMHTGMLGALLTFAAQPLYLGESRDLWDQQLAGLIMWIPGGAVYLAATAWTLYRWLGRLPVQGAARQGHA